MIVQMEACKHSSEAGTYWRKSGRRLKNNRTLNDVGGFLHCFTSMQLCDFFLIFVRNLLFHNILSRYCRRASFPENYLKPTQASYELTGIRRFRRTLDALLPLFVFLTFLGLGGSKASATCGDYLSHHHVADERAASDPVGSDSEAPQIPHRLPCRGPSCQRGPVELPLSTPIVSIEFQDHWVWFASLAIHAPQQISYLVHPAESVVLPRVAFRLDRPPKA